MQVSIVNHVQMVVNDSHITTHRRSRLSIMRMHRMYLGHSLVNQRKHHAERYTVSLQDTGCQVIQMIRKIAAQHGSQVQDLPTFTLQRHYNARNTICQSRQYIQILLDGSLYEKRNLTHIHITTYAESLHRIQDTTTAKRQHIHRHTTRRMNYKRLSPADNYPFSNRRYRIVTDTYYDDIRIITHNSAAVTASVHHHTMAGTLQGIHQMRRNPTSAN